MAWFFWLTLGIGLGMEFMAWARKRQRRRHEDQEVEVRRRKLKLHAEEMNAALCRLRKACSLPSASSTAKPGSRPPRAT